MNAKARVVIERYPTARLPPEIRDKLNFGGEVRIEVQPADIAAANVPPLSAILESVAALRDGSDDPVTRVREEWAGRDEQSARIRTGNAELDFDRSVQGP
jgi:hypothetical protein